MRFFKGAWLIIIFFTFGNVFAVKRLTDERKVAFSWIENSIKSIEAILDISDEKCRLIGQGIGKISAATKQLRNLSKGRINNAILKSYVKGGVALKKTSEFIHAVNAAFIKIDILAIPSHESDQYLITLGQGILLKLSSFNELFDQFFNPRKGLFGREIITKKYDDADVSKMILRYFEPYAKLKLSRIKTAVSESYEERKRLGSAQAGIQKKIQDLKDVEGESLPKFAQLKEKSVWIRDRISSVDKSLSSISDFEKLLKFRISVVNNKTMYAQNMAWFDDYISLMGKYNKLESLFRYKPEKSENVLDVKIGHGVLRFLGLDMHKIEAEISEKIASVSGEAPVQIKSASGMSKDEREQQEAIILKRAAGGKIVKAEEGPKDVPSHETLKLAVSDIPALRQAIGQASLLNGTGVQIINSELSSANYFAMRNLFMKTFAVAVIIPIVYSLTFPVSMPAPVVAGLAAIKESAVFGQLTAFLSTSKAAGLLSFLKNSEAVVKLEQMMRDNPHRYLRIIKHSSIVRYVQSLHVSDVSAYIDAISNSAIIQDILKLKGDAVYLFFEMVAVLNLPYYTQIVMSYVAAPLAGIRSSKIVETMSPFVDVLSVQAVEVVGKTSAKVLEAAHNIAFSMGVVSGSTAIITAAGTLFELKFIELLSREVISLFTKDPERKMHYQAYYTMIELKKSITAMEFLINQNLKFITRQNA